MEKINSESKSKKTIRINTDSKSQTHEWEISKKLQTDHEVYVKQFSDTLMKNMKDSAKPSLRENSNHFILHVGMNDLNTETYSNIYSQHQKVILIMYKI